MKKILVIGSISIDNVVYTKTLPIPGTTVMGESFISNVGGKGANQACAATFLGADVFFYGVVGKDVNGKTVDEFLKSKNLNYKLKESNSTTGVASITIDITNAENRIVIIPGANMDITPKDIDELESKIKDSDILLMQLETPIETVCHTIKLAKKYGVTTILNPAPYAPLPDDLFPYLDFIVPNEHELDGYINEDGLTYEEKAKKLLNKGSKNVIVTLGEKGSLLVNDKEVIKVDPHKVDAVDTTSAGDSFLGAFVTALAEGHSIVDSMKFASKCSSITVTRKGAIASLPYRSEID